MKIDKLPTRLGAEPLLEAVCEMRFVSSFPASNILPGMLLKELSDRYGEVKVNQLPAAMLPQAVRASDPALRDVPLVSLNFDRYTAMIGDSVVAVTVGAGYPGWQVFRQVIADVFSVVVGSKIVQSVSRYSLKYVDLIQFGHDCETGGFDIDLRVGTESAGRRVATIRLEIESPPLINAITVMTSASAQRNGEAPMQGSLIEVDTICLSPDGAPDAFVSNLVMNLDDAHGKNKRIFFESLTQETLTKLEPFYD